MSTSIHSLKPTAHGNIHDTHKASGNPYFTIQIKITQPPIPTSLYHTHTHTSTHTLRHMPNQMVAACFSLTLLLACDSTLTTEATILTAYMETENQMKAGFTGHKTGLLQQYFCCIMTSLILEVMCTHCI